MRKFRTRLNNRSTANVPLTMSEMFEDFMLVKKGEGLAKRTIAEHYKHFEYFRDYEQRDLTADEMTTDRRG